MALSKGTKIPPQMSESGTVLTEFDLGYYGWRVVLAACLGVMAGFGSLFVYTFAVFVKPLGAEFHWNCESVSLGFGLAAISLGLISPLFGRLIDRFGPRLITWTFYAAAGAIGPFILGRAFDSTGSYTSLLALLAGVLSLAAAMNLLLPHYSKSFNRIVTESEQ